MTYDSLLLSGRTRSADSADVIVQRVEDIAGPSFTSRVLTCLLSFGAACMDLAVCVCILFGEFSLHTLHVVATLGKFFAFESAVRVILGVL